MEQERKPGTPVPSLVKEVGTFSERLSEIIQTCGSAAALARTAGVSESVIRKWKNGQSEPTLSNLLALAAAGGRSINWLLTGHEDLKGIDVFFEDSGFEHQVNERASYNTNTPGDWSEFARIPLYNVEASAGHGAVLDQEEIKSGIAFRKDWLRTKGLQPSNLATLTARGDSMEPTIQDGALLLLDCLEKEVTGDAIYIIRSDGHLYAKRLQQMFNGDIYIKSDNPAYTTEIITKEKTRDLKIVGRVIWIGHEI